MKQKMMHDGLGSGPLLNVATFEIITSGHSMKLSKNIHHYVFCVFNKHVFGSFILWPEVIIPKIATLSKGPEPRPSCIIFCFTSHPCASCYHHFCPHQWVPPLHDVIVESSLDDNGCFRMNHVGHMILFGVCVIAFVTCLESGDGTILIVSRYSIDI